MISWKYFPRDLYLPAEKMRHSNRQSLHNKRRRPGTVANSYSFGKLLRNPPLRAKFASPEVVRSCQKDDSQL